MTIRLKHEHGKLEEIELLQLKNHKALPHLHSYLKARGKQCKSIRKMSIHHSQFNDNDYLALHNILKLSSRLSEISFNANHIDTDHLGYLLESLPNKNLSKVQFVDNWIGEKIPGNFFLL